MAKILLFTAEPSNFVPVRLQEEAEKLGHEAVILDVGHCIIAEGYDGEAASEVYVCGRDDPKKNVIGVINKLEVDEHTIVIPRLNEYNLEMKLSMLQRMQDKGATILNSVRSMELCNDKLMSQVTLNTAQIRTPYSFTMQNPDDVEKVVEFMEKQKRLKYPAIVKTLRGTHGIGVMKIDSRSSLVSVAQMLLKEGIEFMVQEFIEHKQSARIIMIGQRVLAANLRGQAKDKDEFRTNSHLGSETEPYEPSDEEVELGKKIVTLFGCNFCAIDYIMVGEGESKEIVVLEVNGSPGLEAISKNWPEKNLPKDVIEFAVNGEPTAPDVVDPDPEADAPHPDAPVEFEIDMPVPPETPMPELPPPDAEPEQETPNAIGDVEHVTVHRLIDDAEARIDTGATLSSIHVDSVDFKAVPTRELTGDERVKFKRGDVSYTAPLERTILIKNLHGDESTRRAVIKLDVTVGGARVNGVEFTLTDRSDMKYEVLIGRNVLEQLGMPVHVAPGEPQDNPESDVVEE